MPLPQGKMAERVHIPVEFIQWAFKTGNQTVAREVIAVRFTEGYRVRKPLFARAKLEKAVSLGLLTKCSKTGRVYQRSWFAIAKALKFKSVTFTTFERSLWEKNSFQDLAYMAAMAYLFSLQEKRRPHGTTRKGKKSLKLSAHNGGISHSLVSAFFGKKSKSWSFKRRRSCEKHGLLRFKRRHERVFLWKRLPAFDHPMLLAHYNTHNGVAREITSKVTFMVGVNLFVPSFIRKGVYGK